MTPFAKRCYQALRKVPYGRVTTYAALAAYLGTKAYRAVGTAMKNNPDAPYVACHRVVLSNGCIGGYNAGTSRKIELLKQEGIEVAGGRIVDFKTRLYRF